MNKLLCCLAISLICYHSTKAQTLEATLVYADSTQQTLSINQTQFFYQQQLTTDAGELLSVQSVERIIIDQVVYYPKRVSYPASDSLIFLEKVIDGTISLYVSPRRSDPGKFFVEKAGETRALRILKKEVSQHVITHIEEYKSVLIAMMHDCPEIGRQDISRLSLSIRPLKRLLIDYNHACGQLNYVENHRTRVLPTFNASANIFTGYSSSVITHRCRCMEYNGDKMFYGLGAKVGTGTYLRFDLANDILIERYHAVDGGEASGNNHGIIRDRYVRYTQAYDMLEVRDQIGLEISGMNYWKVKPFVGVGKTFNYMLVNKSYHHREGYYVHYRDGRTEYSETTPLANENTRWNSSSFLSAGFIIHKFTVKYQRNKKAGYFKDIEFPYKEHRISLAFTLTK